MSIANHGRPVSTAAAGRAGNRVGRTAPRVPLARQQLARVGILGIGSYVPERVLSNDDLEAMVETSDNWIVTRTGMRERRLVAPDQATSDLATEAALLALERSGISAEALEMIVLATATPDHPSPATASFVQHRLGATNAAAFDVSAACSGFVYALMTAHNLVATGAFGNALVIGADVLSSITDYQDRNSCVLFGDGAGAMVLTPEPEGMVLLDHLVGTDGAGAGLIIVPAGGSRMPASAETVARREHFLQMEGRAVFKFAVAKLCEIVNKMADRNGIGVDDIDLLIPHQANLRIVEAAADKLGMDMSRVFTNIDRYGNTSTASVPMALDEAVRQGRTKPGQLICLAAFGGGLTWGASLIEW